MYVFGGDDSNEDSLNDLWEYALDACAWTHVVGAGGSAPFPRDGHSLVPLGTRSTRRCTASTCSGSGGAASRLVASTRARAPATRRSRAEAASSSSAGTAWAASSSTTPSCCACCREAALTSADDTERCSRLMI
ncbi:hypothetical protein T492DRAFT_1050359 [Pavlovales sp. CCMP2436]|nr:hypothetical protein T492DRAFT_1050359 [Pavlovales sp. CCMP2436]